MICKPGRRPRAMPRAWVPYVLLVGAVGVALYLGSHAVGGWMSPDMLRGFLRDLGLAAVISAIVALSLDRLVHESVLGDVHAALDRMKGGYESLLGDIGRALGTMHGAAEVLQGAGALGIESIFARREPGTGATGRERILEAFKAQLARQTGEILVACVAWPECFRTGTGLSQLLWEGLTAATECRLRVLLLCPESDWARIRSELEPGHPTDMDIRIAARFLRNLERECWRQDVIRRTREIPHTADWETARRQPGYRNRIEFKCYDFPPTAFFIITDDLLFIEPYPMLRVKEGEGPIGGQVPMLVLRRDTVTYDRWSRSFEYFWEEQAQDYLSHHPDAATIEGMHDT